MIMDLDETRSNESYILKFLGRGQHYEPDVSTTLVQIVKHGDVVVDVGANVGFSTPEDVGRVWKTAYHDPGACLAPPAAK